MRVVQELDSREMAKNGGRLKHNRFEIQDVYFSNFRPQMD